MLSGLCWVSKPAAKKASAPAPSPVASDTAASKTSAIPDTAARTVAQVQPQSQAPSVPSTPSNKIDSAPVDFFSLAPHAPTLALLHPRSSHRFPSLQLQSSTHQKIPSRHTDRDGRSRIISRLATRSGRVLGPRNPRSPSPILGLSAISLSRSSFVHNHLSRGIQSRWNARPPRSRPYPRRYCLFRRLLAARDAYLGAGAGDGDSDKYAAAAEFAAGNREVQQRKPEC